MGTAGERRPLVDWDGAATALGTTTRHVRQLVERRQIATVKVGGLVRFDLADLEAYIERQRREAVG